MRLTLIILLTIFRTWITFGQAPKAIKGIVVDKSNSPIPYCTVFVKGTKLSATTDKCGEFELPTVQPEFTIVFNCMSTHDFESFERMIDVKEIPEGETVLFVLRNHGKYKNKECKMKVDKRLKKLKV
jgi:hypothetical protein